MLVSLCHLFKNLYFIREGKLKNNIRSSDNILGKDAYGTYLCYYTRTTININQFEATFFAFLPVSFLPGNCQHNERGFLFISLSGKSYCPARVDILRRNLTKTLVLLLPPVDISSVLTMGELIYIC